MERLEAVLALPGESGYRQTGDPGRAEGAIGIEPRDPFLDVRVLEFCLTLPPEQLHDRGWAQFIMRRAMVGRLPNSVRWKLGRDHVGYRLVEIFLGTAPKVFDDSAYSTLARYVRIARERGDFSTLKSPRA